MRSAVPLLAILLGLAGLVVPAGAGEGCTCRANNHAYEQGQIVCIRGRLAQCQMNQNVPSWSIISDACPQVLRMTPLGVPASGPLVHTARAD